MKTILVPVEPSPFLDSVLQTAWLLGAAFGGYIEGFALSPVLSPFMATDAIGGTVVYDADLRQDDETAQESRQTFEHTMTEHARAFSGSGRPSFGWLKDASQGDGFVGAYGRIFDVTVLGRPGSGSESPRMSTLESALFESGRPVLLAPPSAPATLGEVITIAWNRSAETARTVAFAMPLLRRARRVVVLSIDGGSVPGPDGGQLAAQLGRNGIVCEIVEVSRGGAKSAGPAVLDGAAAAGSDLLIKGAFTQSRLSQMIFGGATRHILAEATLPVFMAH